MPGSSRSVLDSPWLSAALVVAVVGVIAAFIFLSGLLGPAGPGAFGGPSSVPVATPGQSQPAPTFVRPTPSPPPTFTTYVVKSGDTLSSIAKAFRTTARSIAWWNRGAHPILDPQSVAYDPNHLEIGWLLVLLPGTVVDENNPPSPSPGPAATP